MFKAVNAKCLRRWAPRAPWALAPRGQLGPGPRGTLGPGPKGANWAWAPRAPRDPELRVLPPHVDPLRPVAGDSPPTARW